MNNYFFKESYRGYIIVEVQKNLAVYYEILTEDTMKEAKPTTEEIFSTVELAKDYIDETIEMTETRGFLFRQSMMICNVCRKHFDLKAQLVIAHKFNKKSLETDLYCTTCKYHYLRFNRIMN